MGAVLARRGLSLTDPSQPVDITLAALSVLSLGPARAIRFSRIEPIRLLPNGSRARY
jgi:putative transcriptional regulator